MSRKLIELVILEEEENHGVEAISLVEFPAIESNWVYFSKQNAAPQSHNLLALAAVDEEKRTLIGAALIPDKHIPRYDEATAEEYDVFFSKDTVKKASELFLKQNRTNQHTFEHQTKVDGVSVVESWIVEDTKKDKSALYNMSVPVGTWMVRVHVANDEMWEQVKEQNVRGFSIEGYFADKAVEMRKAKTTLLERIARGFKKRNLYAEARLESGVTIATEEDELTSGVNVFQLDLDGYPIDLQNGFYKTEAGTEFEVYDGVILKWDGEPAIEETEEAAPEQAETVELDQMKVSYYKHLLKNKYQKANFSVSFGKKVDMATSTNFNLQNLQRSLKTAENDLGDFGNYYRDNYANALVALGFTDLIDLLEETEDKLREVFELVDSLAETEREFHNAL